MPSKTSSLCTMSFSVGADIVLVGAMIVQSGSFHEVVSRARSAGKRVVVGGPYPTTSEVCADADHLVLGEAEDVFASLFA